MPRPFVVPPNVAAIGQDMRDDMGQQRYSVADFALLLIQRGHATTETAPALVGELAKWGQLRYLNGGAEVCDPRTGYR